MVSALADLTARLRWIPLACVWSAAVMCSNAHAAPAERVLARWRCGAVHAPAYLVVHAARLEVFPSTPDACQGWSGACEPGVRPRDGEALVLDVRGPGDARILQQPRKENDFEARVLVPAFELDWNVNGDLAVFAQGSYEVVMRLVPRAEVDAPLRAPGELVNERAQALALEARGDLAGALDAWEGIAVRTSDRAARMAALEKYCDLHPNVARTPSDADRAKIDELKREGSPALEPG